MPIHAIMRDEVHGLHGMADGHWLTPMPPLFPHLALIRVQHDDHLPVHHSHDVGRLLAGLERILGFEQRPDPHGHD